MYPIPKESNAKDIIEPLHTYLTFLAMMGNIGACMCGS